MIDGRTLDATRELTYGRKPNGIAIDPLTGNVVVADGSDGNVSVYSDAARPE